MSLKDIVTLFKNHQIQYGLNGDSNLEELYKWELVSKQNGHPDPNAIDFSKEINSLEFKNLCFSSQITAIRNFAKYEPEEYRKLFRALFDENILLQERVENFTESCKTLWDDKIKEKFTNHTSAMCDERLISCFLAFHNPQKYTFYKNDVYKNLCKLLEVKPRKAGLKLVHFYELLDQYVIPEIKKENELILSINDEIKNNGCIQSMPLTAQTVLWYYNRTLLKNTDTDKEDNENDLVETKIDNTMMYQKYIDLLKESKNLVLTGAIGGCHASAYWAVLKEVYKQKNISTLTASNVVKKDFVFIIDEINRGEASKIFGELFYAIDPGYRGKKDIRVKTQYQNLVPETDAFAEGFYIPENVFILGTMNDIDRSIESMDFAMRRRFTWKEIKPEDTQSMLDTLECATKAKYVMVRLNNEISKIEGLGPAYQVGPSYFLKLGDNGGNFEKLWNMNIEPLLREYIRGFRKSEEIMEKLRNAYFDTKESNSNINDNELVDEN